MGRKKLDRVQIKFRVDKNTPDRLKELVKSLGYIHGDTAAYGEFLDDLVKGIFTLTKSDKINGTHI